MDGLIGYLSDQRNYTPEFILFHSDRPSGPVHLTLEAKVMQSCDDLRLHGRQRAVSRRLFDDVSWLAARSAGTKIRVAIVVVVVVVAIFIARVNGDVAGQTGAKDGLVVVVARAAEKL